MGKTSWDAQTYMQSGCHADSCLPCACISWDGLSTLHGPSIAAGRVLQVLPIKPICMVLLTKDEGHLDSPLPIMAHRSIMFKGLLQLKLTRRV